MTVDRKRFLLAPLVETEMSLLLLKPRQNQTVHDICKCKPKSVLWENPKPLRTNGIYGLTERTCGRWFLVRLCRCGWLLSWGDFMPRILLLSCGQHRSLTRIATVEIRDMIASGHGDRPSVYECLSLRVPLRVSISSRLRLCLISSFIPIIVASYNESISYIHCIRILSYILNNSAKNEPILITFGVQNHEEIIDWHMTRLSRLIGCVKLSAQLR